MTRDLAAALFVSVLFHAGLLLALDATVREVGVGEAPPTRSAAAPLRITSVGAPAAEPAGRGTDTAPVEREPAATAPAGAAAADSAVSDPGPSGIAHGDPPVGGRLTAGPGGRRRVAREPVSALPRLAIPLAPDYPFRARQLGFEGTVEIAVLVDTDGSVRAVEIRRSSGHRELDASAVEAVRTGSFVPGSADRPMSLTVQVSFRLDR